MDIKWAEGVIVPDDYATLVRSVQAEKYVDLYELPGKPTGQLSKACRSILEAMGEPTADPVAHRRLLCAGLSLAVAARPNIDAYLRSLSPWDRRIEAILSNVNAFMLFGKDVIDAGVSLDDCIGAGHQQTLSEAAWLFVEIQRALDPAKAVDALSEITELAFEGYAVYAGSGKRVLFDWWLYEACPLAWICALPSRYVDRYTAP